jgi:hypothetical protein
MANERIPYKELVRGLETDALDEGDTVLSVFSLVKIRDEDGDVQWAARSGGEPISSEELCGALTGLVASIRQDLADEWEW